MRLYQPFDSSTITQRFGDNANPLYASQGLKGHTATDYAAPYGSPIPNCVEGAYCYSLMNKGNPDPSQYRAVFTLIEDETGIYEVSYGHCNEIYAEVGKTYGVGDIIATVGNTGPVYSNGIAVTKEDRLNGSKAGAHLHGPQVRILAKEPATAYTTINRQYIFDGHGVFIKDGYRYYVPDYDNGYNGCVPEEHYSAHMLAKNYATSVSFYRSLVSVLSSLVSLLKSKGA